MRFSLERFISTHEGYYDTALQEIIAGRKQSHWIWYIFPQIQGLGHSTMAQYYEIQDKTEAMEYWNDPVLSRHLVEISEELLKLEDPIWMIMGYPDDLKLRSSMTLFYLVSGEPVFKKVLDKFFGGEMDPFTVNKITEEGWFPFEE